MIARAPRPPRTQSGDLGPVSPPAFVRGLVAAAYLAATLVGCGGDPPSGPIDIKWDRTACDRCRMVLSDRRHSAQVRMPLAEGRSKVLAFDDIGCAIVWLEDKDWRDDPRTEIWVNDWRTGDWIDARQAAYVAGQVTPMGYGLGAQTETDPAGLEFGEARLHVLEVEQRTNAHGGHPHPPQTSD